MLARMAGTFIDIAFAVETLPSNHAGAVVCVQGNAGQAGVAHDTVLGVARVARALVDIVCTGVTFPTGCLRAVAAVSVHRDYRIQAS